MKDTGDGFSQEVSELCKALDVEVRLLKESAGIFVLFDSSSRRLAYMGDLSRTLGSIARALVGSCRQELRGLIRQAREQKRVRHRLRKHQAVARALRGR